MKPVTDFYLASGGEIAFGVSSIKLMIHCFNQEVTFVGVRLSQSI